MDSEKGTEPPCSVQPAAATRTYFPFPFAERGSEEFCPHVLARLPSPAHTNEKQNINSSSISLQVLFPSPQPLFPFKLVTVHNALSYS